MSISSTQKYYGDPSEKALLRNSSKLSFTNEQMFENISFNVDGYKTNSNLININILPKTNFKSLGSKILNELKERFGQMSESEQKINRRNANPFIKIEKKTVIENFNKPFKNKTIPYKYFINRAGLKLLNIDGIFDVINPMDEEFFFAGIAEAPGAMVEYILWRTQQSDWIKKQKKVVEKLEDELEDVNAWGYSTTVAQSWAESPPRNKLKLKISEGWGISLVDKGAMEIWKIKLFRRDIKQKRKRFTIETGIDIDGKRGTGNILLEENIDDFTNKILIGTRNKGCHLVTADGGIGLKSNESFAQAEELHKNLLLAEIIIALMITSNGGNFVLKTFDTITKFSLDMIYLLAYYFDVIYLFKPITSRPTNSEKYVVCKGRKGNPTDFIQGGKDFQMKNKLIEILNNLLDGKSVESFIDNIPNDMIEYFKIVNKYHISRQIHYLKEVFKYKNAFMNKQLYFHGHSYATDKAIELWKGPSEISLFFPIINTNKNIIEYLKPKIDVKYRPIRYSINSMYIGKNIQVSLYYFKDFNKTLFNNKLYSSTSFISKLTIEEKSQLNGIKKQTIINYLMNNVNYLIRLYLTTN